MNRSRRAQWLLRTCLSLGALFVGVSRCSDPPVDMWIEKDPDAGAGYIPPEREAGTTGSGGDSGSGGSTGVGGNDSGGTTGSAGTGGDGAGGTAAAGSAGGEAGTTGGAAGSTGGDGS